MGELRLYDANGAQTGAADTDVEPNREGVLDVGGKTYVWNQRNSQWREATTVAKLRSVNSPMTTEAPKAPEHN